MLATGMRKTTFIPVTIADNITQVAMARISFVSYESGLSLSLVQFTIIAFEFYIIIYKWTIYIIYTDTIHYSTCSSVISFASKRSGNRTA